MLTDDEIKTMWSHAVYIDEPQGGVNFARAIIAAYQDKLRQGVELPEETATVPDCDFLGTPIVRTCKPVQMGDKLYSKDQLLQYGDARASVAEQRGIQAGYLRGLEDIGVLATVGATLPEIMEFIQDKLKGGE